MLTNKKWICLLGITAVLTAVAAVFDGKIAEILYFGSGAIGAFFASVVPSFAMFFCSFACAVLMLNRRTRGTRSRTRAVNGLYGVLCAVFSFIGSYMPFSGTENKSYVIMGAVTAALTGLFIYISHSSFKNTYQKTAVSTAARGILISGITVTLICLAAELLPLRLSYAETVRIGEMFESASALESAVPNIPYISLCGASAAMAVWLNSLVPILPKLKFASKAVFILSTAWIAVACLCAVTSGTVYLSGALGGALLSLAVCFVAEKITAQSKE